MRFAGVVIFLATTGSQVYTVSGAECAKNLGGNPKVETILKCMLEKENEIEALQAAGPSKLDAIPPGAVIPFASQCPSGWSVFAEGAGRVIVGAGDEHLRAYGSWDLELPTGGSQSVQLTPYQLLQIGGEEKHQLSQNEMPVHGHGFTALQPGGGCAFSGCNGRAQSATAVTQDAGGNVPHNNMPPYIALTYCRKN